MAGSTADPKQQAVPGNPKGRLYFVDRLRVVLTINVVVMHSMLTYTSDDGAGMWSGQLDAAEHEPLLNGMFWFYTLGGWAFRMMLFFTLAGYFTRKSYRSKGPARFLWDRTLRLLLPAIAYTCLVQPFLYWISDSSDSAMATAYEAEVEEYGDFYVDALGNDLPVPPPHTRTLGEWYKVYFTEPGHFAIDGPVWFVYNLWWFTVGYVLLMLLLDSATFRCILKSCQRLTASCKPALQHITHNTKHQQPQLPASVVNAEQSVVLQVGCDTPIETAPSAEGSGCSVTSHANSSSNNSGTPPVSIIIEPASSATAANDQATAAKDASTAPTGADATTPGDAAAVAGADVAPAATTFDSTKATDPFPMRRVLLGGTCLILSLWAAQFLVRLVMYYAAAASGNESADFYSTVSYYLISFEPAFIPQYIAAFTLGVLAQKHNGLQRLPSNLGLWCVCSSSLFYVLAWAILWSFEDLRKAEYWGELPVHAPQLLYVLAYGFVEMAFGVVWGVGWLVMFREMFNSKPKRFGVLLIGAAYGVYLIHPIFITLYGRMLEHFEFPSFIVNSIFVAYLTVLSSWLVAMLLKRIPGASRIL